MFDLVYATLINKNLTCELKFYTCEISFLFLSGILIFKSLYAARERERATAK